jgi:sec-independent protein translocase protein TatA
MNIMLAGMLGGWEIILVVAVILLMFGGAKIPQLMGGLGKGIKEFKKASREEESDTKPK